MPDQRAVRVLKRALAPHMRRFTEVYLPLRNRFFAHNFVNDAKTIQELFANTNRKELEETLLFIHIVQERYREEIRDSVKSVLGKLSRVNAKPPAA